MEPLWIVAFSSLAGGFVQAVTGFGGAIIIMMFLPSILSMNAAPALSDTITMILSFAMFWQYRKFVDLKKILFPVFCYLLVSTLVINQSAYWDSRILKFVFGCFLVLLSCYFIIGSGKLPIRPSFLAGGICAGVAGACGGLFGISGPAASLYYLEATKTKEEYLGNINAFFSIGVIFNMISRISNGFITPDLFPMMAVGVVAILIGCAVGSRVSYKIGLAAMRTCVYALMLFAGGITMIQVFH